MPWLSLRVHTRRHYRPLQREQLIGKVKQVGWWKIPATAMYNATVTLVRLIEVEKPNCSIAHS